MAGLLKFIEFIAGRDDVDKAKPYPNHLMFICDKLGVRPSEIVVIGDTHRDIEGAKKIGAPSVAINTKISGYTKQEAFKEADIFIEEKDLPDKLLEALKSLI